MKKLHTTGLLIVTALFILSSCAACLLGFPTAARASVSDSIDSEPCSNQNSEGDGFSLETAKRAIHGRLCALLSRPDIIQTQTIDEVGLMNIDRVFSLVDSLYSSQLTHLQYFDDQGAVNPNRPVAAYAGTIFKRE